MKSRGLVFALIAIVVVVALTMSATLAWAVAADYQVRDTVPLGVKIAGNDLSGLTEAQARIAIEQAVSTPLMRPVSVTAGSKTWTLNPSDFVSVDVNAMLDEAYSTRRSAPLVTRLRSQFTDVALPLDVKPRYSVDETGLAKWVARKSGEVNRPAVDASRTIVGHRFKITPSKTGAKVDRVASLKRITDVLTVEQSLSASASASGRSVSLVVLPRKPKVTESKFTTAIIVSLDQCTIYLYNGDKLVKTYLCAPGQAAYPTPKGDFHINAKLKNSPWINPHSTWSMSMPDIIPPGPNNPMGVTKIGINYSGVFFHGIPPGEFSSIGTHASHGCMRMMPSAVADLYTRVEIGDPVYIRH